MRILAINSCFFLVFLLLVLSFLLVQTPTACLEEVTAEKKASVYLSEVVGLDLSRYTITGGLVEFPAGHSNNVNNFWKEENVDYQLNAPNSEMTATFNFQNGIINFCYLTIQQGTPIYSEQSAAGSLEATKSFLQRYKSYAAKYYDTDTSYIQPMCDSLRSIAELKPVVLVEENTKLQVTVSGDTKIQWIYIENGVEIPNKQVALTLRDGVFCSFDDTWPLYTVGTTTAISKEDALTLALAAANNYEISFVSENKSVIKIKPDLTNATCDSWLSMMPRNSSTLYPFWRLEIHFEKPLYDVIGLQIGIWGDTKEISYLESYGHLGTQPQPQNTQPVSQNENNTTPTNTYLTVTAAAAVAITVLATIIAFKKHRNT